jgi:hypothetical protein
MVKPGGLRYVFDRTRELSGWGGVVLVNPKSARIFNGIFETRKSTQNGENFAKIRARETRRSAVYLAGIYYSSALRETDGLLSLEGGT